jgi:hypothetical protein
VVAQPCCTPRFGTVNRNNKAAHVAEANRIEGNCDKETIDRAAQLEKVCCPGVKDYGSERRREEYW